MSPTLMLSPPTVAPRRKLPPRRRPRTLDTPQRRLPPTAAVRRRPPPHPVPRRRRPAAAVRERSPPQHRRGQRPVLQQRRRRTQRRRGGVGGHEGACGSGADDLGGKDGEAHLRVVRGRGEEAGDGVVVVDLHPVSALVVVHPQVLRVQLLLDAPHELVVRDVAGHQHALQQRVPVHRHEHLHFPRHEVAAAAGWRLAASGRRARTRRALRGAWVAAAACGRRRAGRGGGGGGGHHRCLRRGVRAACAAGGRRRRQLQGGGCDASALRRGHLRVDGGVGLRSFFSGGGRGGRALGVGGGAFAESGTEGRLQVAGAVGAQDFAEEVGRRAFVVYFAGCGTFRNYAGDELLKVILLCCVCVCVRESNCLFMS
eukprot:Rhum_TRINITY_DN14930_c9_g1::Rhum_TRINITY_DN14930_c9_g1_i2::g.128883::m.128883